MSFLLSVGQAFFSGLESIGSALGSAFSSVANDVTGGLSSVANFIQQLPSDIANFFQTVAGAIISFAQTFGGYIWNGLQAIAHGLGTVMAPVERAFEAFGSAMIQAWITIWNDLKAFASGVINFVVSTVMGFVSGVQTVVNDIKNMFVDAYNFLVTVVSDIYAIFTTIANFFLDMPTFFQNASQYLNSLFTDPGNQPNLLTMIPNIIVGEASRIAGAMPDVIGFNTFMELLPKIVYGIANYPLFGSGFTGLLGKALLLMGSPLLTAMISMMTETLMQSFFSSTQTTQVVPRPSQPQIQSPPNLPSVQLPQRSASTASVSDLQTSQPSALTPQQIEVQLERPNVTGVFVQDVIGMGTPGGGSAKLVSGYVVFQNAVQQFQDVFEIVPNFFMQLIESTQYEYSQSMTVDIALTLLENIYQVQQTVEIVPSVDATAIILPPDISFCNPNNVPHPNESASASSGSIDANATVQVQESLCIPPYDLLADTVQEFFGVISGVLANISDAIAESIQFAFGIPYQTNLSDIITEAIQFAFGIPYPTSLTDNVSLTIGFAPIPPSPESYTYYTPVDVPVTYTIEQVGSGSYSGSLSYTVSGS
jgi:hypothetical protein